jgi:hypothetical protein
MKIIAAIIGAVIIWRLVEVVKRIKREWGER